MLAAIHGCREAGGKNSGVTAITDWILDMKAARSNKRFAREVRIAESSVRDLVRSDTLKIFSSETLGRLIEWERKTLPDQLDCQPVMLTRGERVVLAYLCSLARLPKRQYTVKRSKMNVQMEDLVVDETEFPDEFSDPSYGEKCE